MNKQADFVYKTIYSLALKEGHTANIAEGYANTAVTDFKQGRLPRGGDLLNFKFAKVKKGAKK